MRQLVLKSSQAISRVNVDIKTNFFRDLVNVDVMSDYMSLIYYIFTSSWDSINL